MSVERCDIKMIPYFLPFVYLGGVVYLIRILLDMLDSSLSLGNSVEQSSVLSRRRRSYAKVV